jgi:holliday junction DNA helicase RuvA
MIGHLRGKISDKRPNQVVVDVGGVGYEVFIPLSTFYALGELHQDVNLLIHTHVREDTLALYGFVTSREKQLFEVLLSASGVGPVLALKILSGMSVEELLPAIRAGDLARLTTIPGVGRKTAERIVVELRDKLAAVEVPERRAAAPTGRTQLDADVISALTNLGYDRRVAEQAVEDSRGQSPQGGAVASFESLLRATLQGLSRPVKKSARGAAGGL